MSEPSKGSLALLIEKLVAIAQAGIAYTQDPYDRERYEALQGVARELMAAVSGEPISLEGFYAEDVGYRTPKVDVRAVVLRGDDILLTRERIDGKWTLPGGWADIGESPAESVVRELKEETGYSGRVLRLLALFDRAKHGHDPSPWHSYKAFFECDVYGREAASTLETDGVGFFPVHALPPLSTMRVTEKQILTFYDVLRGGGHSALFD